MHLSEDIPVHRDPAAGIDRIAGTEDHVIQRTEAMSAYPADRTAETSAWRRQQPVIVLESHQGNIDRQRPSLGQAHEESLRLFMIRPCFSMTAMTTQAGQIVHHLSAGR